MIESSKIPVAGDITKALNRRKKTAIASLKNVVK